MKIKQQIERREKKKHYNGKKFQKSLEFIPHRNTSETDTTTCLI